MSENFDMSALSEDLAQGIFAADELKRRAALDRAREDAAIEGLDRAYRVLGGRALNALAEREDWPKPPDFERLVHVLEDCNETARVFEGIERELGWCEGILAEGCLDLEGLGREAASACDVFRGQMIEFARNLLEPSETLDEDAVPHFSAGLRPLSNADGEKVAELLREARTAYEKYRRVVTDNGPFALHPTGEPDEDTKLAEEIEYLREANAKPYLGILDDDFMDHVNAFWEGFYKLGWLCVRRADVDLTPVLSYFKRVSEGLGQQLRGKKLGDVDELALLSAIPRDEE